ncbi:MAG: TrkH family potassium uptake protein, partial [Bacteroidetes bacterium]|nr:TrkH family potassium uptake protein [Bacteroidota bacterium]
GNIGPAWGEFGPTSNYASVPAFGKWVLLLLMMIGRLELFTVLVIFTPWFWKN